MLDYKKIIQSLIHRKSDAVSKNNRSSVIEIKKIFPKSSYYFGKVISFCIEKDSIQMACAKHIGSKVHLLDIKKEYCLKDTTDEQRNIFYSNVISEFVDKHKKGGAKVILSLSGHETTFRTFMMPELSKKELDSAITFEVDKQIPFPVEDCYYDYRPVYHILSENQNKYKLTLHAVTKTEIHNILKQFESLQINVEKICHSQDVIGQLFKYFPEFDENKNNTLLNIGYNSTEISFYKGTTLEFSHSSQLSSSMLGAHSDGKKYEYFAESIINEIHNSLDYYAGQFTSEYSSNIFLYGDFAYSSELLNLINEKGGITLNVFPIENLSFLSKEQLSMPEIFPSCMAVLATVVNRINLADLLPPQTKKKRQILKLNNSLKLIAAVFVLFFVLSWNFINNSIEIKNNRKAEIDRQVELFKNSEAFYTYNMIKREVAYNRSYLNKAKESPSYFHLNLKELSNITPKAIKLIHFNYEPKEENNLFMQGVVQSTGIPPEVILAEFVENLTASPFYDNITIVKHIKRQIKSGFQIEFHLTMKGIV